MKPACKSSARALCCEQAMRGYKAKSSHKLYAFHKVTGTFSFHFNRNYVSWHWCTMHAPFVKLQKKSRTSRNELPTWLASWQHVFKAVAVLKAVILWISSDKWKQSPVSCFQLLLPVIIFFRYNRIQLSALFLRRPTGLVIGCKCFPSHL